MLLLKKTAYEIVARLVGSEMCIRDRYNRVQVLEACDCRKFLSIYFDLFVDATGVVCHQLGLLVTDLHAVVSSLISMP